MAITPQTTKITSCNQPTFNDLTSILADVNTTINTVNTNTTSIGSNTALINTINTNLALYAQLTGATFTGAVNVPAGTGVNSAVNYTQLQTAIANIVSGLKYFSARVATTANITLSGLQTIDGVTLQAGDEALVKNQTNNVDNGPYIVGSNAWTRAPEFPTGNNVNGYIYTIREGTTNGATEWQVQANGQDTGIIVGTSPVIFIETAFSLAQLNSLISTAITALQTTIFARQAWNFVNGGTTLTANQLNVSATVSSDSNTITMITPIQNDTYTIANSISSAGNAIYKLPSGTTYLPNASTSTQTSISVTPGLVMRLAYNSALAQFTDC